MRVTRPSPIKEPSSFIYRSDGSGRDSYVIQNSGGLVNDFKQIQPHNIFSSNLRTTPKPLVPTFVDPERMDITNYLNWTSPRNRIV